MPHAQCLMPHQLSIICAYAHNFSARARSPDLSHALLLSTALRLASRRPMPLRDNSRTRKMLHKLLQTSTRFSDASDSATYARHAHTMRIIDLLAHILSQLCARNGTVRRLGRGSWKLSAAGAIAARRPRPWPRSESFVLVDLFMLGDSRRFHRIV